VRRFASGVVHLHYRLLGEPGSGCEPGS
jgi:hypothetical protein